MRRPHGLATATANEAQVSQKLSGQVNGEQASVAAAQRPVRDREGAGRPSRADVANAQWSLDQTTVYAPTTRLCHQRAVAAGLVVVAMPLAPAISFVEDEYQVIALYAQNELGLVEPGNEAEFALNTLPGRIIKSKVDSIVWATGQGQLPLGGTVPDAGPAPVPPGRFAVKLAVEEKDKDVFLAAGAIGIGAVYTDHLEFLHSFARCPTRRAPSSMR